jgi:hypothetical protein
MDNVQFNVFAMKELDYVMSLMSTYGTLEEIDDGGTIRKNFKYTEIIYNHFLYRHAVDDHNNKRHEPISLEVTWATQWWPNRVFAFFLAITEVNAS